MQIGSMQAGRALRCTGILAGLLLVLTAAWAQSAASRGSISGTVTDPQGDAIPGAQVTVRNLDFTSTRALVTNEQGVYGATMLTTGVYSVEVKAQGFMLKKPARVTLNVGASVEVNVRMGVAAVAQGVTVTAHGPTVEGNTLPPAINKQAPEVSNTLAGLTVTYLPNRDRDFSQFGQLGAGVQPTLVNSGLVVAGQRPNSLAVAVDGADFTDPLRGGQRGAGDGSFFFPQTVVREFQIVHSGVSAEVGGTNAGFINIATKEGSNKYRGEAFYIGRPSAFTSPDTFGHSLDNTQNEFGGSIGGPIKKDHAFFYLGMEQDYLDVPYWTQFESQAPGVTVPPSLVALQQQVVGKSDPTAVFARTDVLLNKSNTLNIQFDYNRIHATNVDDGSTRSIAPIANASLLTGTSYWVRGNLTTVFSEHLVNQVMAQWAQDQRTMAPNSMTPEYVINGFGILGGSGLANWAYTSNISRFSDDVAIIRGRATVHLGGSFAYDPARQRHEANLNGQYSFDSLADFRANDPRRYQQTFVVGDGNYDGAVKSLGLYADAKLTLTKKLTLTAGLRWDAQWNPQPTQSNASIPSTTRIPNDLNQWQPRLGLAWNPATNTVVRLSAGLYDAPTPATYFQRVFTDNGLNTAVADSYYDPQVLSLVTGGNSLPAPPVGLTTPAALVVGINPGFRNPRSFQAAGSIEQQLTPKISVSGGYVHNSTWDLQQMVSQNVFAPTYDANGMPIFPTQRPDPAIGQLLVNDSSAHSSYDGMLVTANFQLPKRSQLMANYTLSRARDNNSNLGPFTRIPGLNPYNLSADGSDSSFDVRNNFNISAITNLPKGFKVNPILVARSGMPYTPVIGFDTQNDGNDWNDRAIVNNKVVARNGARQPAFFNLDLRFVKDFALRGEGRHLDLFMDIFNIIGTGNRNFGPEAISVFGTTTAPVFTAGQGQFAPDTNHFGSARQFQFTVRFTAF
jgi:Carboxypeptidase regulatory-like domain